MKIDIKEQILNAVVRLLLEDKEPEKITVRDIVAEANVQLSMINYYFGSKDELMYQAVGVLRDKTAWDWLSNKAKKQDAYKQLREMLISLCEMSIKYSQYMKFAVEYELVKAEIITPQYIVPLIREFSDNKRSEISIRITAYQIISILQLIFIRHQDVSKYLGIDVLEYDNMVEIIDLILSEHFPNQKGAK